MLPCLLPHQIHSCFLVRMKSSSSGQTPALSNTCTLTLIIWDKRNTQWDSMKRSSAGCFLNLFLFPSVCFSAPLDTVQPRSRMFSHSYQFVFSEIRTWAHLTCGCDKWSHISLRDQWDSLLCWWVALCIVCIHTGGYEYLVINSGFESSASFILLVEFFLYFHLKYIVSWVSAVVHRHFEETFVLCIVVTWLLSTPCLVGSWWKDLLLFL